MCANYIPVSEQARLLTFFGVEYAGDQPQQDIFATGQAPFIRLDPKVKDKLIADDGIFGLLPFFATEVSYGRKTYNARTESIAKLPSFRDAWRRSQRCVIPAEALFEPCYETGKAVRWRINLPDGQPMGVAGLYTTWKSPDGREFRSFTMLTVNADDHPVMKRFHKPDEEKRTVVILRPDEYLPWLTCSLEKAPSFFRGYEGELVTSAAALPPRVKRVDSRVVVPPVPPAPRQGLTGDLFD